MASYPAPEKIISVFNPSDYQVAGYDEPTIDEADTRYLKKATGGTIAGTTNFSSALNSGSSSSTTLTYYLGANSSLSTAQAKFGSHSLYVPYVQSGGMMVTGSSTFSTTNFASSWTIEFWYYPISNVTCVLCSTLGSAGDNGYIQVSTSGATLYFDCLNWTTGTGGGTSPSILNPGSLIAASWNHISIGFQASGTKYWAAVNGNYVSTVSAVAMDWTELFTPGNGFIFGNAAEYSVITGGSPQAATFTSPANGYFDEIRFSNTTRYTSSFTVPTEAFTTDANTFFLHHLNGSLINSSQETPTPTTTYGTSMDASGNLTLCGDISSQVGGYSTTTGHISTSRGQVRTYQRYTTEHPGWGIGPSSLFNLTSAISASTTVGTFVVNGPWDTYSATSHSISSHQLLLHGSNTNGMASIKVFVSSKAASGTKMGVLTADYLYQSGSTAVLLTISTSKSSNLTTFSAAISGTANISVTTDSDCRMCWHAVVCI